MYVSLWLLCLVHASHVRAVRDGGSFQVDLFDDKHLDDELETLQDENLIMSADSSGIESKFSASKQHELDMGAISRFHAHVVGLEAEHNFEAVNSSVDAWPVTQNDENVMTEVLGLINKGSDIVWKWQKEGIYDGGREWVWFKTMKYDSKHGGKYVDGDDSAMRDGLMLHLMHHHGLAPLITALSDHDHGKFAEDNSRAGVDHIHGLVTHQENVAKALSSKLVELSLGGIRNLHSYDHSFGFKHVDTIGLQACQSNKVKNWLKRNGINKDNGATTTTIANQWNQAATHVDTLLNGGSSETMVALMSPRSMVMHESNFPELRLKSEDGKSYQLTGKVAWPGDLDRHDGFRQKEHPFTIPGNYVDAEVIGELKKLGLTIEADNSIDLAIDFQAHKDNGLTAILHDVFKKYVDQEMRAGKKAMIDNRDKLWAFEEVHFMQTCNELKIEE